MPLPWCFPCRKALAIEAVQRSLPDALPGLPLLPMQFVIHAYTLLVCAPSILPFPEWAPVMNKSGQQIKTSELQRRQRGLEFIKYKKKRELKMGADATSLRRVGKLMATFPNYFSLEVMILIFRWGLSCSELL